MILIARKLRVREIATQKGINSAAKLSRKADIAYTTLLAIWNGENTSPNLETLDKIAKVLGVGIKDLIVEEDGKTQVSAVAV